MVKNASKRKSTGTLMRKALRYLRKNDKRGVKRAKDPNRMSPAALRHTLEGNRTTTPDFKKRTGGHYRPGGKDFPGRRTDPPTKTHPSGAYEARTEFLVPNHAPPPAEVWKVKAGNGGKSTFFPDDWTPGKIDNAISDAFKNGTKNADGSWSGTGPDGLPIVGYWDTATGAIKHGYPSI